MVHTSKAQREYLSHNNAQIRNKFRKQTLREKRARLMVKNLPFSITEEEIKTTFEKYGEISEVKLLKKDNGQLVGCGFIQLDTVQNATKAVHYLNETKLNGRKIFCGFAMPKMQYEIEKKREKWKAENGIKTIKEEPQDAIKVEDENESDSSENYKSDVEMKEENDNDDIETKEEKDSDEEKSTEDDDESNTSDSDNDSEEEDDSESDDEVVETVKKEKSTDSKIRVKSNDVNEGKTVFVKNIPFEADNNAFRECMQQFGPVHYALICIDKVTDHPKGTGFVKFRSKEDADKCLEAGTELTLFDNILDVQPALSSNDIKSKQVEKEQPKKSDSRNLYLLKEGLILAGTKAAEGVSQSDMALRLRVEQHKSQVLRDLNMYVSKNRLIVHNLPPSWDNDKLRTLMAKHANCASGVIKESRIMRDFNNLDSKGVGKSKEFGFVAFTTHEQALTALRSLNNNPNVFTPHKRPIVGFSIENKVMVNARVKRLEKSKQRNGVNKNDDAKKVKKFKSKQKNNGVNTNSNTFGGIESKPGVIGKVRRNHQLKSEAILHNKQVKHEKLRRKHTKKSFLEKKKNFTRQESQKVNKKVEKDNLSKIIAKHVKPSVFNNKRKSKWYETN